MANSDGLRFVPSRVEGLPGVSEVVVFPDRLEFLTEGRLVSFRFIDLVEWPTPTLIWRALARLGWRPWPLMVGERDWFHPPSERFFRFYTRPRIVVYLPDEPIETEYALTLFRRVQDVMLEGGFLTWDLG
jgi:hypothetical protein